MGLYECLLYNRTLDLIQEFKNIKQNYYKSRGHFSGIPYRKLPVSKVMPCYCLGSTLYFFSSSRWITGLFFNGYCHTTKHPRSLSEESRNPVTSSQSRRGGHEVVKAECPPTELLLRTSPFQNVKVVVLLARSQPELVN